MEKERAELALFSVEKARALPLTSFLLSVPFYLKLDHCIMQFQGFDWLSGHGAMGHYTMPEK